MKTEAQTPFSSPSKATQWDPISALGIINPDCGSFTCVGYAPSKRRRCQNSILKSHREFVNFRLFLIASMGRRHLAYETSLEEAAHRSLCSRHSSQASIIVEAWDAKMDALHIAIALRIAILEAEEKMKKSNGSTEEKQRKREKERQDEEKKEQQRKREKEKQDEEKREQQRRDQEKQDEEQKEQQRRRDQQKQDDEKEKQQHAQERRERESRERRQRDAQRRQEREQQAQERDLRERREWAESWQSYTSNWSAFKASTHPPPSTLLEAQALIPWPVKSGRFEDVSVAEVGEFYRKACPDVGTEGMLKAMQREALKWHTDKIVNLYRGCKMGEEEKKVAGLISRVVIGLLKEARKAREG